jgi:hypothetical protein
MAVLAIVCHPNGVPVVSNTAKQQKNHVSTQIVNVKCVELLRHPKKTYLL